jgi:hypothetical protein
MPDQVGDLAGIKPRVGQRQPELLHAFIEASMQRRHRTAGEFRDFDHRKVLVETQCNQHAILRRYLCKRRLQRGGQPVDAFAASCLVHRHFRAVVTGQLSRGFLAYFRRPHSQGQLLPDRAQLRVAQTDVVIDAKHLERLFNRVRVTIHEPLEDDRDGPESLGHGGGSPFSPSLDAEVERHPLDHRGQIGP